jgi:Bacterial capsule synthesis protein PGA_cap
VSLYGFPREPEATDVETPEPRVPLQRVASAPVAVPSAPPDPTSPSGPPFSTAPHPVPSDYDTYAPAEYDSYSPAEYGSPAPAQYGSDAPAEYGSQPSVSFAWGLTGDSHLNGGSASTSDGTANVSTSGVGTTTFGTASVGTAGVAAAGLGTEPVGTSGTGTVNGGWQTSLPESPWQPGQELEPPISAAIPATEPHLATPLRIGAPILHTGDLDVPDIPPWDRKPLMIVIAAAAVLVLISVISGIASAAMFTPNTPVASWREAGSEPTGAPPASQAPAAPPPVLNDTITLSGVGDVIMGAAPNNLPPNNGAGFFDPVKQALASDLVMGNLETPLTEPTGYGKCGSPPSDGCFQFSVPPSYANHLRDAGFQVLNLANNHTNDMGAPGLENTRAALTAAGLQYTGGIDQITSVTVKGVKVAVLGFSVYSWGANLNNIPSAANLVRKADDEADLVVIQMQGGAEGSDKMHVTPGHETFLGEDRGDLIAFSHAVIDAGADVVFGHGPHIMRGMEFYKGRLIAYSLGNFCGYRVLSTAGFLGVGGVLKVTLKKDGTWAGGSLVPTEMVNGGIAVPDSDLRALAFVDGLSKTDFGANAAVISTTDGKISPPV